MTDEPLLPVRHPNNDFFIADIFDSLPLKDDRHTMEHPFFALSTKKSIETVHYKHNGVEVKLSPSAEFGRPTMKDKDILLYCGSLFMEEVNKSEKKLQNDAVHEKEKERQRLILGNETPDIKNLIENPPPALNFDKYTDVTTGIINATELYLDSYTENYKAQQRLLNPIPKTIRFSCHDLMVTTNRQTNGLAYKQLKNSFERLAGCLITTNIKTNEIQTDKGFHILESYEILKTSNDKKRMVRVEVKLSDWYYNSIISGEVLTINPDYFRLRKPLELRLYELARKFCGYQPDWSIGLVKLKKRCGSKSTLDYFRYQINEIIKNIEKKDHFPDYIIELNKDDIVTFRNRRKQVIQKDLFDIPAIKRETIEKGLRIVEKSGTGWDYNEIRQQFTLQLQGGFSPTKVDGAFINFVKKKVSQTP